MRRLISSAGFGFAATLLVVGEAYAASLALANGCTGGSSSLVTSSGVADGGGGSRAAGTGGGTGATGAAAGGAVGLLAGVGASVGGSGLRAFWALVQTPGAESRARRANSSFSRDRIRSSEES